MNCVAFGLLLILAGVQLSLSRVTVVIDPFSGDDDNCQSVQDILSVGMISNLTACRSIDRALGRRPGNLSTCSSVLSCASGDLGVVVDRVLIQLADGEHRLNGKR